MGKPLRKIARRKIELEPDWSRPVELRYTVALNAKAWRKVHPPNLDAALAAGEAAIRATLEGVSPHPYSVAAVKTRGTYGSVLWDSDDWEDGDDDDE